MKTLVVTDNLYLWQQFRLIAEEHGLTDTIDYACSPGSTPLFASMAADQRPFVIKVKEEYPRIMDIYSLVISMHCKQLFPSELVRHVRCINIHPGLNPYNRGWYPQVFAIMNKMPHGATIHEMDSDLDHGPIIAQKCVPIYEWDTSRDVYDRVQAAELELLREHIQALVQGRYTTTPPSGEGNLNYISDYRKLCALDLDLILTLREAIDLLRALTHPPYKNAWFITASGEKVLVQLNLEVEKPAP